MITVTQKPPRVALCGNNMVFKFETTNSPSTDGLELVVEPRWDDTEEQIGVERLLFDALSKCDTEIGEYFNSGLNGMKQFAFPEQGNVAWQVRDGIIRPYKLGLKEYTMSGLGPIYTLSWFDGYYVMRGEIPDWKKAAFYAVYTSFWQWVGSVHPFLTFSPTRKTMRPDQMEKLYLLIYAAPGGDEKLNLKIDLEFWDGSSTSYITTQETDALTQYQMVEFSVGYSVLGISGWIDTNQPGKELKSYAVTAVKTGDVAYSETRYFDFTRDPELYKRQFIFRNSLGVYDTFLATGAGDTVSEYNYIVVDRARIATAGSAAKQQISLTGKDVHTCRSGFMQKPEAEWMAEFFLSQERYVVETSVCIPIVLHDAKVLRRRDDEQVYFVEFEYENALTQVIEAGT